MRRRLRRSRRRTAREAPPEDCLHGQLRRELIGRSQQKCGSEEERISPLLVENNLFILR